jgi:photosystem II stability/assembly factor-like uncharacterized protein
MLLSSRVRSRRLLGIAVMLLVLAIHSPAGAGMGQWTSTGPFGGLVNVLAVDPQTPTNVYAAAPGGIFKSVDGGMTWARATNGITDLTIDALVIDPKTPTTLYAGAETGGGVFKSTDGANSWTQLSNAPTIVNALAINPQTTSTLYAGSPFAGTGTVFKSTDGGMTWAMSGSGLPNGTFILAINPQTPTTLYAGEQSQGIFKSLDGGNSWAAANNGFSGSLINVQALAINPQNTSTLYAAVATLGGPFGLFESTNDGASWSLANSLVNISSNLVSISLAINPQTPFTLFVGGFGIGALVSTNGGASFTPIGASSGLTSRNVLALAINPQNPAALYAGTSDGGVFASANAGASWSAQNTGLTLMTVTTVTVDPSTPTTIYAGTVGSGLFKSLDGGSTWASINTGITTLTTSSTATVKVISIDPVNPSTLYAAGASGFRLFKSTNGGANWSESDTGLGFSDIADLAIDPQTTTTLYAGFTDAGVYKSTDGGGHWTAVDNGLTGGAGENIVNLSIAGAPTAALFASTVSDGPFVSLDGGASWSQLDFTLPGQGSGSSTHRASSPLVNPGQFLPCLDTLNEITADQIEFGHTFQETINIFVDCRQNITNEENKKLQEIITGVSIVYGIPQAGPNGVITNTSSTSLPATLWGPTDGAYPLDCQSLATIIINPLDPTNFYAGAACGVLRGTNSGAQFVSMSLGLPPSLQVNALGITSSASDLYAGTQGGGIYRFTFADSPLAAAVLPSSRSVEVGTTATAFATIINASQSAASGCGIAMSTSIPATFLYQTTDPATNALTGSPNAPVTIAAGSAQTFLFALTPAAAFDPIDAQLDFDCAGTTPVAVLPGINTVLISGSTTAVPDIIALVATATNDGILHIPGASGSGAFAVATDNIGAAAAITVAPVLSTSSLPLVVTVCQTNPGSGQCLAPPGASATATVNSGDTPTFGFFATASGAIPFDPVNSRISCQFTDANGVVHGSTSIAVETQ